MVRTLIAAENSSLSSTTRCRSVSRLRFRQQLVLIMWICVGALTYGVLLFGILEDRSLATIQSLNELHQQQFLQEQAQPQQATNSKSHSNLRGSVNNDEKEEDASDTHKGENNQPSGADFLLWHTIISISILCYIRRRARMHPRHRPFSSLEIQESMVLQVLRRRLNQQRREQGEGPLSTESLRLIFQQQDFGADDYERLWAFQNEHSNQNGAVRGATREEIGVCPQRIIQQDELSHLLETNDRRHDHSHCVICLERYQVDEAVRTVPCMHSFHSACIDRWLQDTASCPICKQSIAS